MVNSKIEKFSEKVKDVSERKTFIRFMNYRFPNENSDSYIQEWVDRFNTGNPKAYMDLQSQKAYHKAQEVE